MRNPEILEDFPYRFLHPHIEIIPSFSFFNQSLGHDSLFDRCHLYFLRFAACQGDQLLCVYYTAKRGRMLLRT